VSAITNIFLTPFILHHLGDEAYGLWVLIVSLSDYYLFLQVGVRSSTVRYVSRSLALQDYDGVSRIVSTGFYYALAAFAFVTCMACASARFVPSFFSVKPVNVHAFFALFLMVGIAQAFDFPISIFEGALEAVGRFDQLYGSRIAGMLLRVVLLVVVLKKGGGFYAVGTVTILSTLGLRFVSVPLAFREVKGFHLRFKDIHTSVLKEMWIYSFTSFSIGIGQRMTISLYPAIIAKYLSAAAVTMFALPTKLLSVPLSGIGSMTEFANPLSSDLEARQDKTGLQRVLVMCGEFAFLLFAPLAALLIILGRQTISLWVGPSYSSTYPLLVLLTFGTGIAATQASTQSIIFGMGRHKGLIWVRIGEGIATAALGILFMRYWGLWGYALATMVVALIVNLILMPHYVCTLLDMPVLTYLGRGCLRPSLLSLPLIAALWLFQHFFPITSWAGLILAALIGGIVYAATLLAGPWIKRRLGIPWPSVEVLHMIERRFLKGESGLDLVANPAALPEFEKAEYEKVLD
jgi:O-antigen/teichoic acid export membrane protein